MPGLGAQCPAGNIPDGSWYSPCNRCNLMLGFANDQPEILRAALGYLAAVTSI